ncbi:lantibiotic dehydratase [Herbidospora sp. RD11066]
MRQHLRWQRLQHQFQRPGLIKVRPPTLVSGVGGIPVEPGSDEVTMPIRYRHADLVLVRASTCPEDLDPPAHLNGREWLAGLWVRDEVRQGLSLASPVLAASIDKLLKPGVDPTEKEVRRVSLSVAAYLLRWKRRATPFGLFAGVAAARLGPAAVKIGTAHRAVARPDAHWLMTVIDRLEKHPRLRPHLMVVADSSAFVRDGRLITARRADAMARVLGPVVENSVRHTRPVQVAMAEAATPIRFDELATRFPGVAPEKVAGLLNELVDQAFLITNLRPPMTVTDPLAHLREALHLAGAWRLPDLAVLLEELDQVAARLTHHNHHEASALAVDLRLDAQITLPEPVFAEAERAAGLLLRLTSRPFGSAAWLDYHSRFRGRYGDGALVPVRELVADSGLGYPTGYLGAPRARPVWRMLSDRDAALLALIQKAVVDGAEEIELTEADIDELTVGDHADVVPPDRVELGVAVQVASAEHIDRGAFQLWITAAPRAHTSMAARFAHLLDEFDRESLAATYTTDQAVAVQISFPPRSPHNQNVVRVPRLLPDVVALAEHSDGEVIGLDDLAVTADAHQMYLVQLSTGRRVQPRIPHALETTVHTPPLARFLAEVADARSAVFGPLDVGAARTLPYIPRIRHRRIVLAAARWILTAADLPSSVDQAGWEAALTSWRRRWRVPAWIVLCQGELRLPLDLDRSLDRDLLRARLERAGRIELQEAGPRHGMDWAGRPVELLIPMTLAAPISRPLPTTTPPGPCHRPGHADVVHAQISGNPARFDDILTDHLLAFIATLGDMVEHWWVRRHRDMTRVESDQHLAVLLRLSSPEQYGAVTARLAAFAARLAELGLPGELILVSYSEQPGRYGSGSALQAAERVFAADTAAAIAQIGLANTAGVAAQALAAVSMADLAAAFSPDPGALLRCLNQEYGALDRSLRDQAFRLTDLRSLPGGDVAAAAWQDRRAALIAYRNELAAQRDPADLLRTLLHEHHRRALGVDPAYEKVTGRLARAVVLRQLALAGAR